MYNAEEHDPTLSRQVHNFVRGIWKLPWFFPISPTFAMLQTKLKNLTLRGLVCQKNNFKSIRIQSKTFGPVGHSNSRCGMNPSPDKRVQPHPFLKTKSFPCPPCIASGAAIVGRQFTYPPHAISIYWFVLKGKSASTDVGLNKSDFGLFEDSKVWLICRRPPSNKLDLTCSRIYISSNLVLITAISAHNVTSGHIRRILTGSCF